MATRTATATRAEPRRRGREPPEDIPHSETLALFAVRLGIAAVFLVTGLRKLTDPAAAAAAFGDMGIPAPGLLAPLVGVAEFFGALGILVGVLPRFSAAVLAVVMVVAMLTAKAGQPFYPAMALEWVLLLACLAVVVGGPGRPTIASVLHRSWLDLETPVVRRLMHH